MKDSVLLGSGHQLLPIPGSIWQRHVRGEADLGFMSVDHHRVRNYVVTELPRAGEPLPPASIAQALSLPADRVGEVLDDLEQHMTFLFRNGDGAVAWAYPVTVDRTPHRVTFSSGEQIYAAWAIDAIATPFVQGRLRGERLSFAIQTECAHCQRPIHIEIDSELNYQVLEEGAEPLIQVPMVNVHELGEPSIIDGFWIKSVFFWSEEHLREHRRQAGGERCTFLTLAQSVYITPLTQGPLFGFGSE